MLDFFDGAGIRFRHPPNWSVAAAGDDQKAVVEINSEESFFAVISLDAARPDPDAMVAEALEALRAEYARLDDRPSPPMALADSESVGRDVEFFTLDLAAEVMIRSTRTPRRTITLFAQWSEGDEEPPEPALLALIKSIEETDGPDDE